MLRQFSPFPQIQVIDLDAAMGRGSNDDIVRMLASKAVARVGGGVRTVGRAQALVEQGAHRVIVERPHSPRPASMSRPGGARCRGGPRAPHRRARFQERPHRSKRLQEATQFTAEDVLRTLEPYCSGFLCTYVDKEGMLQGTDLDWFRRLRAATTLELTAAGGITTMDEVRALLAMDIHVALGMAIYTGRLRLAELAAL